LKPLLWGMAGSGGTIGKMSTSGTPDGGLFGGGGGSAVPNGGTGGRGAVRIIWPGTTRSFPSTDAGNV
jgi:hypothetical protein